MPWSLGFKGGCQGSMGTKLTRVQEPGSVAEAPQCADAEGEADHVDDSLRRVLNECSSECSLAKVSSHNLLVKASRAAATVMQGPPCAHAPSLRVLNTCSASNGC